MKIRNLKINSINLILMISTLSYFGCSGQINNKEIKSTEIQVEVVENNLSSDSIKYNQYRSELKYGIWRTHYGNGKLKSESNYVNGKKEGLCREWWETGSLWTEGIYKNGKANGLMKWHNQEGVLVAQGNMVNDKRDGKWNICDIQLVSNCIEANFKNDKKVGNWQVLHDNGKVWKEQNYKEGKLISEKCWDENGNPTKCS